MQKQITATLILLLISVQSGAHAFATQKSLWNTTPDDLLTEIDLAISTQAKKIHSAISEGTDAFFDKIGEVTRSLTSRDVRINTEEVKNGKIITLSVDLPGFGENNIKVRVKESGGRDVLSIEAEKQSISKTKTTVAGSKNLHSSSHASNSSFSYQTTLPNGTNKKEISASYKDGVLDVTIPVQEEKKVAKNVREIPIG